jgi:hypothetical protein
MQFDAQTPVQLLVEAKYEINLLWLALRGHPKHRII